MKTIIVQQDLEDIKKENSFNPLYFQQIEIFYKLLVESLRAEVPAEDFSLEDSGYIVVLEEGDDVRDLSSVGLNPEDEGLLGSIPEYVEKYSAGSIDYYKIVILYDNEYIMTFFSQVDIHDQEVEDWLAEHARESEIYANYCDDSMDVPF